MKILFITIGLLLITGICQAQTIYRSLDEQGVVTFSDKPIAHNSQTQQVDLADDATIGQNAPIKHRWHAINKAASVDPVSSIAVDDFDQQYNTKVSARHDIIAAYKTLNYMKQILQKKIATYQEQQDKLDSMSPSDTAEINRQNAQLKSAQQEVSQARANVTEAETNVAKAEEKLSMVSTN